MLQIKASVQSSLFSPNLLIFYVLFLSAVHTAAQVPILEKLDATQGLSQGMIYDLEQDRQGFLWFATKDGLNRYDGYNFKVYLNNPFDPFSLSDNEVQSMAEDRLGRLWIGTVNDGINIFNRANGKFYHFNGLTDQSVTCLTPASDGTVWAGTSSGVFRIQAPEQLPDASPELSGILKVEPCLWEDPGTSQHFKSNHCTDLMASGDGKIWVSTFREIGYYDTASKSYFKVYTNSPQPNGDPTVSNFEAGPDGSIWVGQPGQLLRIRSGQTEVFTLPERSVFPLSSIVFDANGTLFLSTRKQIYKLPQASSATPSNAQFELFYHFPEEGIIGSTQMLMDRGGLLWIGTNGYGILKYNAGNYQFEHNFPGKSPRRIFCDHQGRAWAWVAGGIFFQIQGKDRAPGPKLYDDPRWLQHDGVSTGDGNLWLLCEKKENQSAEGQLICLDEKTLQKKGEFPIPINIRMFARIFSDNEGSLWICGDRSQLARFDLGNSHFETFDFSGVTGYRESSLSISIDPDHQIWIGTAHGLVEGRLEGPGNITFKLYKNRPEDMQSLNCNAILCWLDDPKDPSGVAWIGTKGGGLNRLDKRKGTFRHITNSEGLANNVVYGVLPDAAGFLWLSTNCGLSCYDPATGYVQNFFSIDGLQDNEFNTLSYAAGFDGKLYFGGVNGITSFYPGQLQKYTQAPPVFLTGLKINNIAATARNGMLPTNIEQAQKLILNYTQNQLTFEFAAIDFAAPRLNRFSYHLIGADQDWLEPVTGNNAKYSHLRPGKYVFEVKTGGSRGIWNGTPARLEIVILPPYWQTWWAYCIYMVLFGVATWLFYRFQMNRIRLKNELAYEHREARRLAELDQMKTDFFNGVTHEFRTPLTLLLEPARQLLNDTKDTSSRYRLELIQQNARRLLHFVNQLLDLSKMEAGRMPLNENTGYPLETLRRVMEGFEPLAKQRGITLSGDWPENEVAVVFDEIKWEQVFSNLLSNALKFTDQGGEVRLSVEISEESAQSTFRILVTDSGIGIPAEALPHIFERFYQAGHLRGGSGIGLALCKQLVERMGGHIGVESTQGKGTRFVVELPCEKALSASGIAAKPERVETLAETPASAIPDPVLPASAIYKGDGAPPFLLIIEDDAGLRQLLRASMPPQYRIAEAADGEEGIQMALDLVPDLIISDLVMPGKSGFEVVQTLKSDPGASHIPIILLTAKASIESRLEGLSRGADVYLTKPFRSDELILQIENLLSSRRKMQAYFSDNAPTNAMKDSAREVLPAPENEFLQRLIEVVERNLENDNMDAEGFAKAVFVSRSQLHRKVSALTGLPLSEFVRNYRLDRAKELLSQKSGSITEIAWRTGFSNPKYFSTCFKERFGTSPSRFIGEA